MEGRTVETVRPFLFMKKRAGEKGRDDIFQKAERLAFDFERIPDVIEVSHG